MELAIQTWQEIRDRDGLIASVVQFDAPPPGWVEATPVDVGVKPDTGT
jgi:hypothetical protein